MAEVLNSAELRLFGLKAIGSSSGWFAHFASTAMRDAMLGTDAEAGQALRILASNWKVDGERIIRLIKERWLPHPERDSYSWMAIYECPIWTDEVEEIAGMVLKRSPISARLVNHTAQSVAVEQPEVALRLVGDLDFLLADAAGRPEQPAISA